MFGKSFTNLCSPLTLVLSLAALTLLPSCGGSSSGSSGAITADHTSNFTGLSPNSVTINWTPPAESRTAKIKDRTPATYEYKVVKSTVATDIDTFAKANAISDTEVTHNPSLVKDWFSGLSWTIAGLDANQKYYFVVLIRTVGGPSDGESYDNRSVTTLKDTAPTVGDGPTFSDFAAGKVTVSWDNASDDHTDAGDLQYKLVHGTKASDIDTIELADAVTGTNLVMDWTTDVLTADATHLQSGVDHYFAVLVKNQFGDLALYGPAKIPAPTVSISDLDPINSDNAASYEVFGECSEEGQHVIVAVGGLHPTTQPTCGKGHWGVELDVTSLADGDVVVTADQTNLLGIPAVQATATVSKNTTTPVVTISTHPIVTQDNVEEYVTSGTCSVSGQTVSVTIFEDDHRGNPHQNADCTVEHTWTATFNLSSLLDGPLGISATQDDGHGNTGTGHATMQKDTTAPIVSITSAPTINSLNASAYPIGGDCSENAATVTVTVGGVNPATQPTCASHVWTATLDVSSVLDGDVSASASQIDTAGNSGSGSAGLSKDTVVPTVSITLSPDITLENVEEYTVSGDCSEEDQTVTVHVGSLVPDEPSVCTEGHWSATLNAGFLDEGSVSITADHMDSAGNPARQATASVNKDTLPPEVTITTHPNINSANVASYAATGTCSEAGRDVVLTFKDAAVRNRNNKTLPEVDQTVTCAEDHTWTSSANLSILDNGEIAITADQSDANGNAAETAEATTLKDSTAPTVTIESAPTITSSNASEYPIWGTCSELGRTVTVAVGGIAPAMQPICVEPGKLNIKNKSKKRQKTNRFSTGGAWGTSLDVSSLVDGDVTVTADHSDANGNNATQASVTVTKDTTGPTVTIDTPLTITSMTASNYPITGTCSEEGRTVTVSLDLPSPPRISPPEQPNCVEGHWSTHVDASGLDDGSYVIHADHSDADGNNATQASAPVLKDATTPTVTIEVAPNITAANQANYVASGTCSENGRDVVITIGALTHRTSTTTQTVMCADNVWATSLFDVSGAAEGSLSIMAEHSDSNGNNATPATQSLLKDTVVPIVTLDSFPVITQANQAAYVASGTCSEIGLEESVTVTFASTASKQRTPLQQTVDCSGGGTYATSLDVSGLPDGGVTITAYHSDAAGNVANAPQSTTKSTAAKFIYTPTNHTGQWSGDLTNADTYCKTNANNPLGVGIGTWKAMLADGTTRQACTTANCGCTGTTNADDTGCSDVNSTWVMAPHTSYKNVSGTTVGTTNKSGIFIEALAASINSTETHDVRTGLASGWLSGANNCNHWASTNVSFFSDKGAANITTTPNWYAQDGAQVACSGGTRTLFCVQQ